MTAGRVAVHTWSDGPILDVAQASLPCAPSLLSHRPSQRSHVARRHHALPCRSARRISRPRGRHCRVGRPPQRRERGSERAADGAVCADAPDSAGSHHDGRLLARPVRLRLGGRGPERLRHARRHPAPRPAARRLPRRHERLRRRIGRAGRPLHCDQHHLRARPLARRYRPRGQPRRRLADGRGALGRSNKRLALANDPLNLLAVSASANRQKGDDDAAAWLPANKAYRCVYVARQLAVKLKYALWATSAERGAMQRVLTNCPMLRLPAAGSRPVNLDTTRDPAPRPSRRRPAPRRFDTTTSITPTSDPTPPPPATTPTPAGFCDTHACIPSFASGHGTIVQCNDGLWSQSGGIPGASLRPRRREAVALSLPAEHRSRRGARQRAASEVDPHHNAP